MKVTDWNDNELHYCCLLVGARGDDKVGDNPKTIAAYLRMQSAGAFRSAVDAKGDGVGGALRAGAYRAMCMEISAALATAATAINSDARNNHAPDWTRAERALLAIGAQESAFAD